MQNTIVSPLVRKPIRMTNKFELKNSENFWIKRNINIYDGKHFAFVVALQNLLTLILFSDLLNI